MAESNSRWMFEEPWDPTLLDQRPKVCQKCWALVPTNRTMEHEAWHLRAGN